jgi:hypothetical protein
MFILAQLRERNMPAEKASHENKKPNNQSKIKPLDQKGLLSIFTDGEIAEFRSELAKVSKATKNIIQILDNKNI